MLLRQREHNVSSTVSARVSYTHGGLRTPAQLMSQLRFGSVPKQFSQLPGVTSSQAACASRLGAWRDRVLRHVPAHRESDTISGHYLEYSVKTYCGVLAAVSRKLSLSHPNKNPSMFMTGIKSNSVRNHGTHLSADGAALHLVQPRFVLAAGTRGSNRSCRRCG